MENSMGKQEKALWEEIEKLKRDKEVLQILLACILRMLEKYVLEENVGEIMEDMKMVQEALKGECYEKNQKSD